MGLVLDSTVFITAERRGLSARQTLEQIAARFPGEQYAISVVTLVELSHGVARADSPQRMSARQQYLDELIVVSPVQPISVAIALRAGQIDGESTARGVRLPISDLLIGATALELGYKVATSNLRHFQLVPGLEIVSV
ncbi:MAG: PIN domain-containing protein [Terracidiphilus sp.]